MWAWKGVLPKQVLIFDYSIGCVDVLLLEQGKSKRAPYKLIDQQRIICNIFALELHDVLVEIEINWANIECVRVMLPNEILLEGRDRRKKEVSSLQQYQLMRLKLLDTCGLTEDEVYFDTVEANREYLAYMVKASFIQALQKQLQGLDVQVDMICVKSQLNQFLDDIDIECRAQYLAKQSIHSPLLINFIDWRGYLQRKRIKRELTLLSVCVGTVFVLSYLGKISLQHHIEHNLYTLDTLEKKIASYQRVLPTYNDDQQRLNKIYTKWSLWQSIHKERGDYIRSWHLLEKIDGAQVDMQRVLLDKNYVQISAKFISHQQMSLFVDWLTEQIEVHKVNILSLENNSDNLICDLGLRLNIARGDDES